jgi:hypothetical protein
MLTRLYEIKRKPHRFLYRCREFTVVPLARGDPQRGRSGVAPIVLYP